MTNNKRLKWLAYVRRHGIQAAVTKARNANQPNACRWLERLGKHLIQHQRLDAAAQAMQHGAIRSVGAVAGSRARIHTSARPFPAHFTADGSMDELLSLGSDGATDLNGSQHHSGSAAARQAAAGSEGMQDADGQQDSQEESPAGSTPTGSGSGSEPTSSGSSSTSGSSSSDPSLSDLRAEKEAVAAEQAALNQRGRAVDQKILLSRLRSAKKGEVLKILQAQEYDKLLLEDEGVYQAYLALVEEGSEKQQELVQLMHDYLNLDKVQQLTPGCRRLAEFCLDNRIQQNRARDHRTLLTGEERSLGRLGPINRATHLTDAEVATELHAAESEGIIQGFMRYALAEQPVPPRVALAFAQQVGTGAYPAFLEKYASESRPGLGLGQGAALPGLGSSPGQGDGSKVDSAVLKTIKQPSPFTGTKSDSEPVRRWLTSMSHYLTITRVPKPLGVGVAVTYLRGEAQVYWFSVQKQITTAGEDPTDWEVFRKWLVLGFGALDPEITARDKAERLRQTGSVEDYARTLLSYFTQLVTEPMAERDQIRVFHNGLKPNVAANVQVDPVTREPWTSLHAAVQYAIRWDNANKQTLSRPLSLPAVPPGVLKRIGKLAKGGWQPYHDPEGRVEQLKKGDFLGKGKFAKQRKRFHSSGGGGGGGGRKPFKGGKGSDGAGTSRDAQTAQERRQEAFHNGECFHCHEKGHKKYECPLLKKK